MNEWRIPPLGWCSWCLREGEENAAVTLARGTGYCRRHFTGDPQPTDQEASA